LKGVGIAAGLSWLFLARLSVLGLSFASTAVLARLLAPKDFGVMAAAMVVIALSSALFEGSFGMGLVQKLNLEDKFIAATFWTAVALSGTLFFLITATSPLVERFFGFPRLAGIITLTSATLVFKAVGSVSSALLQRQSRYQALAAASLVSYFFGYCLLTTAMAFAGYGVWSLAAGAVASGAIETAMLAYAAKPVVRFRPNMKGTMQVIRANGLFTLTQFLNWSANSGGNTIVGRSLGAEPLGVYSRAWKLLDIAVSATGTPLYRVLFPAFARLQTDLPAARRAFLRALGIAVPVFAVISAVLVIHSRALVLIALGPKWTDTVLVAQILFAAFIPRNAFKISEGLTFGFGRSRAAAFRQGVYAVMMVCGSIVGVRYGPVGVATAVSISITLFYILSLSYAMRLVATNARALLVIHIQGLLLIVFPILSEVLVLFLTAHWNFWFGQLAAGGAGLVSLAAVFFWAPHWWIGEQAVGLRREILKRMSRITEPALGQQY
jgi:O-antigen/teichoic acid export membrane protein